MMEEIMQIIWKEEEGRIIMNNKTNMLTTTINNRIMIEII